MVVSLGADGAVASIEGETVTVEGFDVGHSVDTTGAGDLYVAAWAWGDAMGMDVHDTLRWAALYAALSVRVPTGAGGATKLAEFVAEGHAAGPARSALRRHRLYAAASLERVKWTWLAATALVVAGCGGGADTPAPTATPTRTPTAESARVAPLCERADREELGRAENPAITELSGLARTEEGRFWTHNDSGDGPRVFELDTTGAFLREVAVQGAEAYDWEDHRDPRRHAVRRGHR